VVLPTLCRRHTRRSCQGCARLPLLLPLTLMQPPLRWRAFTVSSRVLLLFLQT
jgi:hypothetical protein